MGPGLTRAQLIDQMSHTTQEGATAITASYFIAASDATDIEKAMAHATCSGASDDVIINAALTALSSGGRIALSSGTFSIASPIIPGTAHSIVGQGRRATTLKLAANANCDVICMSDDGTHRYGIAIRDLQVDGNKDNNTSGNGIVMHAAWWSDITNVIVKSCAEKGIYYSAATGEGGQRATLRSVDVQYCAGTGIDIASGANTDSIMDQVATYSNGMTSGYNVYICSSDWQIYDLNASTSPADLVNVRVDGAEYGAIFYGLIITDTEAGATGLQFHSTTAWNYHSSVIGGYIENTSTDTHTGYGIELKYGGTKQVQDSRFSGVEIEGYAYGVVLTGALVLDTIITDCKFKSQATSPVLDTATRTRARNNTGYIAPGEVREYSGSIATLTENAYNSVDNPFGQDVLVLEHIIYVSTGATATTPNLDCGIGSSATTDYTTLHDDAPGETTGAYSSVNTATTGKQTSPILWQTGTGNRYLNHSIKDAAATGMVATYTVRVMGV